MQMTNVTLAIGGRSLTISVAAGEEAHAEMLGRMIDDRVLSLVKPTAHLINVARGTLVDHEALLRALDAGRLHHATLDVTDPEPLPKDHPLMSHERATITPHAAWYSPDHFDRVTAKLLDNLGRYANGEPLADIADFARGY